MRGSLLQTATRRFFQKFGYALAWAVFFGAGFGALSYYRVSRASLDDSPSWHERLRLAFEQMELWAYDWRVRALGAASRRSDRVVPVLIDDDTVESARLDEDPQVAAQPWPREVIGRVLQQLASEGAAAILVELSLSEVSGYGRTAGDGLVSEQLTAPVSAPLVLSYGVSAEKRPLGQRGVRPYLTLLGEAPSLVDARDLLTQMLARRVAVYAVPSGAMIQVWGAVETEARGQALAAAVGRVDRASVRRRTAADDDFEVTAGKLVTLLSAVTVEGLDVRRLPRMRAVEPPAPAALSNGSIGALTQTADADGVVRGTYHLLQVEVEGGEAVVVPSSPLATVMALTGERRLRYDGRRLYVGDALSVPMQPDGYSLLKWDAPEVGRGGRGAQRRVVPAWRVWVNAKDAARGGGGLHHDNELADRVVLLGSAHGVQARANLTPIGSASTSAVVGQALVNLLDGGGIERVRSRVDLGLCLALALLGAVAAVVYSTWIRREEHGLVGNWVILTVLGGAYAVAARHLFLERAVWIAVAAPLWAMTTSYFAALGYATAIERRVLGFMTALFGSASAEAAAKLADDASFLHPERRALTVFFSDIEGLTAAADRMAPEQLVALLREYLTEMTAVVHGTQGQVDKYIGDAVMAFWGAPVRLSSHADAACASALRMQAIVDRLRGTWASRYGVSVELSAGLNTGEVVVGEMGSDVKVSYTVMGEAVGVAARLEQLNKRFGTRILVGERTAREATAHLFREVDRLALGGRGPAVPVFELIGLKDAIEPDRRELLARYAGALEALRAGQVEQAAAVFEACAESGDRVAAVWAQRCRTPAVNGAQAPWAGALIEIEDPVREDPDGAP